MKINRLLYVFGAGIALLSSGCIDDKYDLTDIDTTTRLNVNDLVIPINIDEIQLKSIIDVKDDDANGQIKIIDGEYAYVKWGDFTTGDIKVAPVTINAIKSSTVEISIPASIPDVSGTLPVPLDIATDIPAEYTNYDFKAESVSQDICDLKKVMAECDVRLDISLIGLEGANATVEFENLRLLLPEGMALSSISDAIYDEEANSLVINSKSDKPGFSLPLKASSLTLAAGQFDKATHSINIAGSVGVVGGKLKLNVKGGTLKATDHISLKVAYTFSPMQVTAIDGQIRYQLDDVNIPEIDIKNLPDVLNQEGTEIILTNPQIYLSVNNPLYVCGAYAQTGFEITSYIGETSSSHSIDNPYFTIAANAVDNFCLSPQKPKNPDPEYPDCQHVGFKSLSRVLYGQHIPEKLKVNLVNPQIPEQPLTGFLLGHNYGNVRGKYKFVAPLQFDAGSGIKYTDRVDGWSSDDLDKLTVTSVTVKFKITTDIPMQIDLTGNLLDKSGKVMPGVNEMKATIGANANEQEVTITATGNITNLDGIEFCAKAAADADGQALSPDMKILLKEIRPSVTGYYQTEL